MRVGLVMIISAILLTGCSASDRAGESEQRRFESARTGLLAIPAPTASALAFTPPVAWSDADYMPDRSGRVASAYLGYETTSVSSYWVKQDDRQRWGRFGDYSHFERRAVSATVTTRVR